MKLIVLEEKVFIKDIYGALSKKDNDIKVDTSYIKDSHLYKYEYAFDTDTKFKEIKNKKMPLPDFKDNSGYAIIKVKMTNLATGDFKVISTEPLDISHYYYLGKPIEDVHPNVLAGILERLQKLENRVSELETEGDLI